MDSFLDKMVGYMNTAIESYKTNMKEKLGVDCQDPWILFVISDDERNVIDQKIIEYELQVKFGVKTMRCTFSEI